MTDEKLRRKFPSAFPDGVPPKGAKPESVPVYRICRTGKVESASFLPTYLDPAVSQTKENVGLPHDCDYYSLSTYEKRRDANNKLKFFKKRNPPAILAKGTTDPSCGVSQRTKERTGTKSSHVDWWLYDKAQPHTFFQPIEEKEESS